MSLSPGTRLGLRRDRPPRRGRARRTTTHTTTNTTTATTTTAATTMTTGRRHLTYAPELEAPSGRLRYVPLEPVTGWA